ncbi:retroviral-like aspartic protease family protein [bacterium]|nr:retroviral-like aspartic protease family protein [bacterium]
MTPDSPRVYAFTNAYPNRSNVLVTKVSISSAFDPSIKPTEYPRMAQYLAIWDTGATNTVVTQRVAEQCGLHPTAMTQVSTAGGVVDANIYLVNVGLPNKLGIPNVRVTEGQIGNGIDLLIGMDIIGLGDMAISNFEDKTTFTFRIPSIEVFDFDV